MEEKKPLVFDRLLWYKGL